MNHQQYMKIMQWVSVVWNWGYHQAKMWDDYMNLMSTIVKYISACLIMYEKGIAEAFRWNNIK